MNVKKTVFDRTVIGILAAVALITLKVDAADKNIAVDEQPFTAVHFSGTATLHISQGKKAALQASGTEETLNELSVKVRNGTLFIDTKEDYGFLFNNDREDVSIDLVVVDINELKVKGSADVDVQELDVRELLVQVNGASDLVFHELYADTLTVNANGANEFSIEGEVQAQDISLKGASEYNALGLASDIATIMLAGSGDAEIQVEKELDVRVYGVGEVAYLGSPKVNQSVRGMGSVKRISI